MYFLSYRKGSFYDHFKDTNIVIVNTCTVKTSTWHKILIKLKELENSYKLKISENVKNAFYKEKFN